MTSGQSGALVAVLLNPPGASAGTRSRNAVSRAAYVLGYDQATIVNLCTVPTPTVVELSQVGADAWQAARPDLEAAIGAAAAVLGGWGVSGLTRGARNLRDEQVRWLRTRAQERGIRGFWMVGGEPRHPSRWHQYVSDKYGRTDGGSFEERLRKVLAPVPLERLRDVADSPEESERRRLLLGSQRVHGPDQRY